MNSNIFEYLDKPTDKDQLLSFEGPPRVVYNSLQESIDHHLYWYLEVNGQNLVKNIEKFPNFANNSKDVSELIERYKKATVRYYHSIYDESERTNTKLYDQFYYLQRNMLTLIFYHNPENVESPHFKQKIIKQERKRKSQSLITTPDEKFKYDEFLRCLYGHRLDESFLRRDSNYFLSLIDDNFSVDMFPPSSLKKSEYKTFKPSRDFNSFNGKFFGTKHLRSMKYYDLLLRAYLNLPKPRFDFLSSRHSEHFISILFSINPRFFNSTYSSFKRNIVACFYDVLSDLLNENSSKVSMLEQAKLLELKYSLYRYRKISDGEKFYLENNLTKKINLDRLDLSERYKNYKSKCRSLKEFDSPLLKVYLKGSIYLKHENLIRTILKDIGTFMMFNFEKNNMNVIWDKQLLMLLMNYYLEFTSGEKEPLQAVDNLFSDLGNFNISLDSELLNEILRVLLFQLNDINGAEYIFEKAIAMSVCVPQSSTLQKINYKPLTLFNLRNLIRKSNIELTKSPMLYRFKVEKLAVSYFISYYCKIPYVGEDKSIKIENLKKIPNFKQIIKLTMISEYTIDDRLWLLNEYNRFNPGHKFSFKEIHENYRKNTKVLANKNASLGLKDFQNILDGFAQYNMKSLMSRSSYPVQLSDLNSWNFINFQIFTKYYLLKATSVSNDDVISDSSKSELSANYRFMKKFLKACLLIIYNGNISQHLQFDPYKIRDAKYELMNISRDFAPNSEDKVFNGEGWPFDLFNGTTVENNHSLGNVFLMNDIDFNNHSNNNKSLMDDYMSSVGIERSVRLIYFLQHAINLYGGFSEENKHTKQNRFSLEHLGFHVLQTLSNLKF